ncbi:hypothetical protein VU06_02495, partial [Desulfobulbus sp. F3]|nr:hypothetical protein [Desulfobulbus sp. F3]
PYLLVNEESPVRQPSRKTAVIKLPRPIGALSVNRAGLDIAARQNAPSGRTFFLKLHIRYMLPFQEDI